MLHTRTCFRGSEASNEQILFYIFNSLLHVYLCRARKNSLVAATQTRHDFYFPQISDDRSMFRRHLSPVPDKLLLQLPVNKSPVCRGLKAAPVYARLSRCTGLCDSTLSAAFQPFLSASLKNAPVNSRMKKDLPKFPSQRRN